MMKRLTTRINSIFREGKLLYPFLFFLGCFLFSTNIYAQDSDGDGIIDAADLDDDNDGILDFQEGFQPCPGTNYGEIYVNTGAQELGIYDLDNNTTNILCSGLSFTGGDIGIAPVKDNLYG